MQKRKNTEDLKESTKPEQVQTSNGGRDEKIAEALEQAEADMEQDPDLSTDLDPAADLDEGELARLEGDD